MTWTLTIVGDCQEPNRGSACMVTDVSDYVHGHSAAADTVEQLVCEQFHDTYPRHCICDITWAHKEESERVSDHSDGCSYQSCTCKPGPMTEREAAERLAALLNEFERGGREVYYATHSNRLWVGDTPVQAPRFEGDEWMVAP